MIRPKTSRLLMVVLAALLALSSSPSVAAQDSAPSTPEETPTETAAPLAESPQALLEAGLAALETEGPPAALVEWVRGGPQDKNPKVLDQAEILAKLQTVYGAYEDHQILHRHQITPRMEVLLAALHFAKGPLFVRIQAYRVSEGGWVATELRFHADASQLLPESLTYGLD